MTLRDLLQQQQEKSKMSKSDSETNILTEMKSLGTEILKVNVTQGDISHVSEDLENRESPLDKDQKTLG